MKDSAYRRFRRAATTTVVTIFLLILVGGTVRATGAGMGCPDWPTCFGQWIPPTSVEQLPADYQRIYADRGYADTVFNARKTWTEYLNRLLGAFTGLAILATLAFAWPLRRREPVSFALSAVAALLVMFQGWLGSRVVASNLDPGMITLHMLLAQVILGLLVVARLQVDRDRHRRIELSALPPRWHAWLVVAMALGLLQLLMGTQVRESVDLVARSDDPLARHLWIDALPIVFALHKWFALPVLALNGWLILQVLTHTRAPRLRTLSIALGVWLAGASVIGVSMDRLHVPMAAQPLHLWLASLIFATQLAILLVVRHARSRSAPLSTPRSTLAASQRPRSTDRPAESFR